MFVTVFSTVCIACIFLYWFVGEETSKGKPITMIMAIQQRDKAKLRTLSTQPRYRDAQTNDGDTPMHFIARLNAIDMANILIQAGADVNKVNNYGYTPIMIAAERGYERMVKMLLDAGAETHHINKKGHSAVDLAHRHGNDEVIYLLDQTAMINQGKAAS